MKEKKRKKVASAQNWFQTRKFQRLCGKASIGSSTSDDHLSFCYIDESIFQNAIQVDFDQESSFQTH